MDSGWPVTHVACKPDEWAEIDFHPDLTSLKKRLGETVDSLLPE